MKVSEGWRGRKDPIDPQLVLKVLSRSLLTLKTHWTHLFSPSFFDWVGKALHIHLLHYVLPIKFLYKIYIMPILKSTFLTLVLCFTVLDVNCHLLLALQHPAEFIVSLSLFLRHHSVLRQ